MSTKAKECGLSSAQQPTENGLSSPLHGGLENPPSVEGWESLPLGQFAQAKGGYGFPMNRQGKKSGTYPFFKVSDMNLPANRKNMIDSNNWVDEDDLRILKAKTFPSGAVVFPKIGATILTNKKRLLVRASVIDNNVMAVVIQDASRCGSDFLYYWFRTIDLGKLANPGTVPSITSSRIHDTPVLLPPLAEQQKIAAVLGVVQRAMEQQERLLALTAELKKALLHQLFTAGLRGEPQKQTDLGPIPQSWDVAELGNAVEQIDYGFSAPIPKTPPENGVKIVSTADITKDGRLLYKKIRRIEAPEKTVNRLTLRTGDVLFNWRNSAELIGKSAVFQEQDERHIFASFVLRIKCGEKKSHNFFLMHLMNHFRETQVFIKLARRAVNQANYNRNEISVLKIPLPSHEEQREIADAIGAVDAKIDLHRRKHAALTALFRTLLHELMTARIRVHNLNLPELEAVTTNEKP